LQTLSIILDLDLDLAYEVVVDGSQN